MFSWPADAATISRVVPAGPLSSTPAPCTRLDSSRSRSPELAAWRATSAAAMLRVLCVVSAPRAAASLCRAGGEGSGLRTVGDTTATGRGRAHVGAVPTNRGSTCAEDSRPSCRHWVFPPAGRTALKKGVARLGKWARGSTSATGVDWVARSMFTAEDALPRAAGGGRSILRTTAGTTAIGRDPARARVESGVSPPATAAPGAGGMVETLGLVVSTDYSSALHRTSLYGARWWTSPRGLPLHLSRWRRPPSVASRKGACASQVAIRGSGDLSPSPPFFSRRRSSCGSCRRRRCGPGR